MSDVDAQTGIKFEKKYPWKFGKKNELRVWSAGEFHELNELCNLLSGLSDNAKAISDFLKQQKNCFGIMISGRDFFFASVDRVRGYPIFYHPYSTRISNHAQNIEPDLNTRNVDSRSLMEFAMAGYVTGAETLLPDVKVLQAGEWLCYEKGDQRPKIHTYYQYSPRPKPCKYDDALKGLGDVLDEAIQRSLSSINGAPVWVPLSGGLDSRLMVAKLQEHGCENLHTYSYGLRNNFEARTAKRVAEIADVPWQMIAAEPQNGRNTYNNPTRVAYEEFSHGYGCITNYTEFESVFHLKRQKIVPDGAFIINGQTGDFISGGHIPEHLYSSPNTSLDEIFEYFIDKHFSMWTPLKSEKNKILLKEKFKQLLLLERPDLDDITNLMRQYESFEWRERQTKMVIHGQRCYDFFGYQWALPLWDSDVMDYFENLPLEYKLHQNLFKDYLRQYNYKGLFDFPSAAPHNWAKHQYWILVFGFLLGKISGQESKENFYKKMLYFGSAHYQWALFGPEQYKTHYQNIRNMISLCILDFIESKKLDFPKK